MGWLFLIWSLLAPAIAEDKPGTAAQLIQETSLRKEASEDAKSLGRLPKGTVLTLQGDRKNGFVFVEVELEDGSIEGWVRTEALNRQARGDDDGDDEDEASDKKAKPDEPEEPPPQRPRTRVSVPKDEGLLLRRDPTFFYGLQAGGGLVVMVPAAVESTFIGPGFGVGAHLGYYVDRNIPIHVELGYSQLTGSDEKTPPDTIQFGFLDIAAIATYSIGGF